MISSKYSNLLILLSVLLLLYILTSLSSTSNDSSKIDSPTKVAIIVLGGGLTKEGNVPMHTNLRLQRAKELLSKFDNHATIITLSGGTPHKPNPLDSNKFPIWEASAAAKKLIVDMEIPPNNVMEENFSLDTIGNAYFLRTIHLDPGKYTDVYVITNDWHIPRTKAIFEYILNLPTDTSATKSKKELISFPKRLTLHFEPVSSGINDETIVQARIKREMKSLRSFEANLVGKWATLEELHQWLFTEHDAYASKRLSKPRQAAADVDDIVSKTY